MGSRRIEINPLVRFTAASATALVMGLGFTSCGKEKKAGSGANDSGTAGSVNPSAGKKPDETKPLPKSSLDEIVKFCSLVKVPGQADHPGVLLEGMKGTSSSHNYLVLCDAPANLDSVNLAYQIGGGIGKSTAKKISRLDSGLSIFGFISKSTIPCVPPGDPAPEETLHAIHLEGVGTIASQEQAAIESELASLQERKRETQAKLTETMKAQMEQRRVREHPRDPRMRTGPPPVPQQQPTHDTEQQVAAIRSELADLSAQESKLNGRLRFPISSIAVTEAGAAAKRENLERLAGALDLTLLATSSNTVRAVRSQGKWTDLQDVLSQSGNRIDQVKLRVSGSKQSVSVDCAFDILMPTGNAGYSMVAATTFELESMGSGSLAERLARVEAVPLENHGATCSVRMSLTWNGQKTSLWIKLFKDDEREKPIIDEVILLDYPESFAARWGKPPSPLITLPPAKPDSPEDLVKEQRVLDAKGAIKDLVAAGDGSVVMVQTDQPPYWQPLDLKTGQWTSAPWHATADTLLATQAGKIYLLSTTTKVLEIWDLASGKRDGLQLLAVEGPIIAVAAPLSSPTQPVFVATGTNAYLLDPVKFEVMSCGLELESCFVATKDRRGRFLPLKPGSIWLRASDDGSLYSISGTPERSSDRASVASVNLTVDRSSLAVMASPDNLVMPSRGRARTEQFPDHGGSGTGITVESANSEFPGALGTIRFTDGRGRSDYAVMNNPPVFPSKPGRPGTGLLPDRGVYQDSGFGVVLLPDGDKLNFVRVNLPDHAKAFPEFVFSGESVEIPRPAGSGHKLTTDLDGETVIGDASIKWTAPKVAIRTSGKLKLDWTGELGTLISKEYPIQIYQESLAPVVESADGRKSIPLKRRGILPDEQFSHGCFAGSGNVAMASEDGGLTAWNLTTCERLFRLESFGEKYLGDADRLYLLRRDNEMISYDLATGKELGKVKLGKALQGISTGIASRLPLIAAERESLDPYLMLIQRDTLKSELTDLPEDTRRLFFSPQFSTNVSGSLTWASNAAVFRDKRAITIKPFEDNHTYGVPDASGRFIVGRSEILDISTTPPRQIEAKSIAGLDENSTWNLDESGRFLIIPLHDKESQWGTVSIRTPQAPAKELFKIRFPKTGRDAAPCIISDTKTLIRPLAYGSVASNGVFVFDIPEIIKELSR